MADVDAKAAKNKDEKGKGEKRAEARRAEVKKTADKLAKKNAAKPTGFFRSVSTELKKVHWPDKERLLNTLVWFSVWWWFWALLSGCWTPLFLAL